MPKQYPIELRQRAVRLVAEQREQYQSEYEAIRSIAAKLGITTPETLRKWVRQSEIDSGRRPGTTAEESAELRELRAENKELRRANVISSPTLAVLNVTVARRVASLSVVEPLSAVSTMEVPGACPAGRDAVAASRCRGRGRR